MTARGDGLEQVLGGIGRLTRLMSNRRTYVLAATVADIELSQQEMQVLRVAVEGAAALGEVARRARMDAGAVSRQIPALERAGLVTRRSGPGNTVVLAATGRGREVVDDLQSVRMAQLQRALRQWSNAELAQFAAQLHRCVDDTTSTPYLASDRRARGPAPGQAPGPDVRMAADVAG